MAKMDDDEVMALCEAAWHYGVPIDDETEPWLKKSLAYGTTLLHLRLRAFGREIAKPFETILARLTKGA